MSRDVKRPYEIGYANPPAYSRFKKGQSGNPKGRPNTSKSVNSKITNELDRLITMSQDGERSRLTKREAVVLLLLKKAIQGNARAIEMVLTRARAIEPKEVVPPFIIEYFKDPR